MSEKKLELLGRGKYKPPLRDGDLSKGLKFAVPGGTL